MIIVISTWHERIYFSTSILRDKKKFGFPTFPDLDQIFLAREGTHKPHIMTLHLDIWQFISTERNEIKVSVYINSTFLEDLITVPVAGAPDLFSFFLQYLSRRCLRKNIRTGMWRVRRTTSRIKQEKCFNKTSWISRDIFRSADPPEVWRWVIWRSLFLGDDQVEIRLMT